MTKSKKSPQAQNANLSYLVDLWFDYEEIRRSGKYNMVMDSAEVCQRLGMNTREYAIFLRNYGKMSRAISLIKSVADEVYS